MKFINCGIISFFCLISIFAKGQKEDLDSDPSVIEGRKALKSFIKEFGEEPKSSKDKIKLLKSGKGAFGHFRKKIEQGVIKDLEGEDILDKGKAGSGDVFWTSKENEEVLTIRFKGTSKSPLSMKIEDDFIELSGNIEIKSGDEVETKVIEGSIPIPEGLRSEFAKIEEGDGETFVIFPRQAPL